MSERLTLEQALKHYFNFNSFRTGQKEVVEEVLGGNNVLTVMPTGQGKSLCYQLPALLMPGITVVVSPLVALMKDQVDALHGKNLYQATFISSQLTQEEQRQRLEEMGRGKFKLVYVAPERLKSRLFCAHLARLKVSLLTVDEAHCVSHWGHDFRPDYLSIREFHRQLTGAPKILALTATATPAVQEDILEQLGIPDASRVIAGSDRPNLFYSAKTFDSDRSKLAELEKLISARSGSGLVYVATRKDAEKIAAVLAGKLRIAAAAYHAGLQPEERSRVQDDFLQGRTRVVVGTNAFGMGIDKSDIRFVIHYCLPASLEAYYQEVGRAGRDGGPADCMLFFTHRDRQLQEWIIDNDALTKQDIIDFWQACRSSLEGNFTTLSSVAMEQKGMGETKLRLLLSMLERIEVLRVADRDGDNLYLEMGPNRPTGDLMITVLQEARERSREKKEKLAATVNWIHSSFCRRAGLLSYFGEEVQVHAQRCCDNCLQNTRGKMAESNLPLAVFACIKELPRLLGQKRLVDVLRGSRAKDILEGGYDKINSYGKFAGYSSTAVRGLVNQLMGDGFLKGVGDEYPVIALTPSGEKALEGGKALPVRGDFISTREENSNKDERIAPAVDKDLLAALKEFRAGLARKESLPPYIFFHDRVLEEIAAQKPVTTAGLSAIKGIGEKKIARYGEQLVGIVRGFEATSREKRDLELGPSDCAKGDETVMVRADSEPATKTDPTLEPTQGANTQRDGKPLMLDTVEFLFNRGMTVPDIAQRTGRAVATVEGYLAALVAENRISIDSLVPWPLRRQIYRAMEQVGIKRLRPVKELLPEEIPYSAIRYVQACLLKGEE